MKNIPNAEIILGKLIEDGRVDEELVMSMAAETVSDSMKHCVGMVHTMFCHKNHGYQKDDCSYYGEDDALGTESFTGIAHKAWIRLTLILIDEVGATSVDDMIAKMSSLNEIIDMANRHGATALLEKYILAQHDHTSSG